MRLKAHVLILEKSQGYYVLRGCLLRLMRSLAHIGQNNTKIQEYVGNELKTKAEFPVCTLSIVIVWAPKAEVGIGP